jgi:hypothetical protein
MHGVSSTAFATRLTHLFLGHSARQISYYMILMGLVVIQQVNAIGRLDLPFEHDAIAM